MYKSHQRLSDYGIKNATTVETNPVEVLRTLRDQNGEKDLQGEIGGSVYVSSQEVLLAYLRKLSEASEALLYVSTPCKETQEDLVRSLRVQAESGGTPYRSKLPKQPAGKYPDPLPALSQLLARDSEEAWSCYSGTDANVILGRHDWETGYSRVVEWLPNRVDRLRCLGNAVVPQQVFPFLETIARIERGEIR